MAKHDNCHWHEDRPAVGYCTFCGRPVCDECHTGALCRLCMEKPPKRKSTALLLAVFLGWLGVHRYYMKKYVTGVLYTLTFGLFTIGWVIDVIRIFFWSTISEKEQAYFVGDHPPYCTVGIKNPNKSTGSLLGDLGDSIVEGMSSDTRWFFDRRFWRDEDTRPLLPISPEAGFKMSIIIGVIFLIPATLGIVETIIEDGKNSDLLPSLLIFLPCLIGAIKFGKLRSKRRKEFRAKEAEKTKE